MKASQSKYAEVFETNQLQGAPAQYDFWDMEEFLQGEFVLVETEKVGTSIKIVFTP